MGLDAVAIRPLPLGAPPLPVYLIYGLFTGLYGVVCNSPLLLLSPFSEYPVDSTPSPGVSDMGRYDRPSLQSIFGNRRPISFARRIPSRQVGFLDAIPPAGPS